MSDRCNNGLNCLDSFGKSKKVEQRIDTAFVKFQQIVDNHLNLQISQLFTYQLLQKTKKMSTHYTQNASVPVHRYGLVSRAILTGMDPSQSNSFEKCVIFGVTSVPSRALMFSIMCESGAQWARIPLHMLRHEEPRKTDAPVHSLCELQMWDNHGWEFSVTCYEYLRDMSCSFMKRDGSSVPASYWFTLDHTENGWSLYPPEHKCYHLLFLEDGSGQIAAQPNNRIRWKDDSFTNHNLPLNYRVMGEETWHAEVSRVNAQDTAFTKEDMSKFINNIVASL